MLSPSKFLAIFQFFKNHHTIYLFLFGRTFNFVEGHVKEVSIVYLKEGINSRIKTAMNSQDLSDILTASSALLGCYENFRLGPTVIDSLLGDVLLFLNKVLDLCFTYLRYCTHNIIFVSLL